MALRMAYRELGTAAGGPVCAVEASASFGDHRIAAGIVLPCRAASATELGQRRREIAGVVIAEMAHFADLQKHEDT